MNNIYKKKHLIENPCGLNLTLNWTTLNIVKSIDIYAISIPRNFREIDFVYEQIHVK